MKKIKKPLVSVVMPVHNAGEFLVESIESILNQTYKKFELIIVDDASTDNSLKIINRYKKNYPKRIKVIKLKRTLNRSGDPAANLGIKKAQGKYIAKMDADDIADPKRLEKQVEFLEKNKRIFLAGTQVYVIDKAGKTIGKKTVPLTHNEIYNSFFLYSYICHPTIMFRNINKGKDFYQLKFPYFNEYYTFFKLMNQGKKFANMPDYLLQYRIHGQNNSFSHIKTKFLSTMGIKKEFVFKFGYEPSFRQILVVLAQSFFVFLMPDKVVTQLYLLSRRIITPADVINSIKSSLSPYLSLAKRFRYFLIK